MIHSDGSRMLLTVRYFSQSQVLQIPHFVKLRKTSENKLREVSRQDHKSICEKGNFFKSQRVKKLSNWMEVFGNLMGN